MDYDEDGLSPQDKISIGIGARSISLWRWLKCWLIANYSNPHGIDEFIEDRKKDISKAKGID